MQRVEGRVGLVTPAGSGSDRATAVLVARGGARLGVADWDLEGAQQTTAALEAEHGPALCIEANVSDEASAATMIRATVEHFGALHSASNNAGLGAGFQPLTEA